jgi:hypothetical protein
LHRLARSELIKLGLLQQLFRTPDKTRQLPEFDEHTGMLKASHIELSSLGRLLLRRIGVAAKNEF